MVRCVTSATVAFRAAAATRSWLDLRRPVVFLVRPDIAQLGNDLLAEEARVFRRGLFREVAHVQRRDELADTDRLRQLAQFLLTRFGEPATMKPFSSYSQKLSSPFAAFMRSSLRRRPPPRSISARAVSTVR